MREHAYNHGECILSKNGFGDPRIVGDWELGEVGTLELILGVGSLL